MKISSEPCISRYPKSLLRMDPVDSLTPYIKTHDDVILFAGDLLSEASRYRSLLAHAVGEGARTWKLYFPPLEDCELVSDTPFDSLVAYLAGNGYSTAVYIADLEEKLVCYSNNRDSFSFCVMKREDLDPAIIARWDADFANHLKNVGVGFGAEGHQYISSLLKGLANSDPTFHGRIARILLEEEPGR